MTATFTEHLASELAGLKSAGLYKPERVITSMQSASEKMLARGIYVIGFSFPVVPKGQARIRTQMSAAHAADDIDQAVAAFGDVGKELGIL